MVEQHEIDIRAHEIRSWYDGGYYFKCVTFQRQFTQLLSRAITSAGLQDARVESRTKSSESLVEKAVKVLPSGDFKYVEPRREITDLVGARVMVPLSNDIQPVAQLVRDTFQVEEEIDRGDEEAHLDVPGYRSLHMLARLRPEHADDPELRPFADMAVEIQVRTTLQHAWASLQHDVMYKTERPPSPQVKRRLIALAGLLELADHEFIRVRNMHAEARLPSAAEAAQPDRPLTAAALRNHVETALGQEDSSSQEWWVELKTVTDGLGITTVGGLEDAWGHWRARAAEVAEAARRRRPWLNNALVADLLLRLSRPEAYFEARPPWPAEVEHDDADVDLARRGYLAELEDVRREVDLT